MHFVYIGAGGVVDRHPETDAASASRTSSGAARGAARAVV